MSRDSELSNSYREILTGNRQVDGEWYLFEQTDRVPRVMRVKDGLMVDEPYTMSQVEALGWTATPVKIFRTE